VLPREIFLEVCCLELRDIFLCMISILRGGFLEIFLNLLYCIIFCFLPGRLLSEGHTNEIFSYTLNVARGLMMPLSKISTNARLALTSAIEVGSRSKFRMFKGIPFSRLSLIFSHVSLVVDGSASGSNEASTVFAL
jgi:hypothetical protein